MQGRSPRLAIRAALGALLLGAGLLLVAAGPVEARCLSPGECDALREQLRELRSETRAERQELRELVRELRDLPRGSPERRALRAQVRDLRKAARARRAESRPLRLRFRRGCRNC